MPRQTVNSIEVSPNVRALRIYPVKESSKASAELQTVGIKLAREQAIHLARVLLAVSQDWETVEITAHRLQSRQSDGTYGVTVTSFVDDAQANGG